MSEKLGPLPDTVWLLHMPAQPYESEWTSSMAGYTAEQMREYASQEVAKELERWIARLGQHYGSATAMHMEFCKMQAEWPNKDSAITAPQ